VFSLLTGSASHELGTVASFRLVQEAIYFETAVPGAHPYVTTMKCSLLTPPRKRKVLRSSLRRSVFVRQRTSLSSDGTRSDDARTPIRRRVVG